MSQAILEVKLQTIFTYLSFSNGATLFEWCTRTGGALNYVVSSIKIPKFIDFTASTLAWLLARCHIQKGFGAYRLYVHTLGVRSRLPTVVVVVVLSTVVINSFTSGVCTNTRTVLYEYSMYDLLFSKLKPITEIRWQTPYVS